MDEPPLHYCKRLAVEKGYRMEGAVVLSADTIVCLAENVFEKPKNDEHAFDILRILSGKWHEVISAWSLCTPSHRTVGHCISKVRFRPLSDIEIHSYIATGEGRDKAGGYGIQGKGAALIDRIEGSYSNIVGLPLAEVLDGLEKWGIRPEQV